MLQSVEAIINPDGTVRLLENLKVPYPTRVILTLLPGLAGKSDAHDGVWNSNKGCVADTLAFLTSLRHRSRPIGNAAAIEQAIQENRDAWGDE
jgi:hypothetical protein